MCGIAGVLCSNEQVNHTLLEKMTSTVKHRGPDDEGFYVFSKEMTKYFKGDDTPVHDHSAHLPHISECDVHNIVLGLGHRRLSIIDTSFNGHQPMRYKDKILVFNGEIYNYLEVRAKLELAGYTFATDSDSEVLLVSFEHWGPACVHEFDGMWSFAIWNESTQSLFCSRDRFGEKPFFYFFDETRFIFGSEIKQILAYGVPFEVNETLLNNFLFHYTQLDEANETYFKHIVHLKAGHNLSVQFAEGKPLILTQERYYTLNKVAIQEKSLEAKVERVGVLLETSIQRRLRSDVTLGSCLSGGLDSSTIVTLATKQRQSEDAFSTFNTFTAMYDDHPSVDERYYSSIITKETNSKNHQVKPSSAALIEEIDHLIWHQEEPFTGFSIYASWCVMKAAKQAETIVLLDGQGGDEVFLGYGTHVQQYLLDNFKLYRPIKTFKILKDVCLNNNLSLLRTLYVLMRKKFKLFVGYRTVKKVYEAMNEDYLKSLEVRTKHDRSFKSLEELQRKDLESYIQSLLKYEDRNAMAHSVETRLPFLAADLVEYGFSLPNEMKFSGGWTKSFLRLYMQDKMSQEVTYRKTKLGFAVPEEAWVSDMLPTVRKMLTEPVLSQKYFNVEWLKQHCDKPEYSNVVFKFIIVEKWLRLFSPQNDLQVS